jgi:hypothetical protein
LKNGNDSDFYSTVIKYDLSSVLIKDYDAMRYFLTLSIDINIADLWVSHYTEYQQYLYNTILVLAYPVDQSGGYLSFVS